MPGRKRARPQLQNNWLSDDEMSEKRPKQSPRQVALAYAESFHGGLARPFFFRKPSFRHGDRKRTPISMQQQYMAVPELVS